ncbi:hypothetical protein [Pseudorhodoplanes sp.]|uniref:hypothetical protein n=1 Tax=Pseudorhodoplanes sp. TaxID=1934341 RepID=UPI003D0A61F1
MQLDKALKDKVERALASYVAKARVEQKGPSAKEVTAFVERLIAVSTDASNVLEELQRLEPVVVEVKRQLRKTLIRASDPSRAESPQGTPTKSSKSQELLELNSFLGSKAEIRRLRALNGHFLSASEQVLSHSKAEGSTTEKTALLYCLQELREIYTDAGGKATAGSNDRPSAFSRFAFALLDGLPRPTPKRSIEEINNLIRNHLF